MDKLKTALYFTEKYKWRLFPAFWDAEHKRHISYIKWAEQATSDAEIIKRWAFKWKECHFCVACQASDITVLDVDNKKGKHGDDVLNDLILEHGSFATLKVKTPSGGYHYYFKGKSAVTINKLGFGLDTPVMVPLPNSEVIGKGRYAVVNNTSICALPEWLRSQIGNATVKNPDVAITNSLQGLKQAAQLVRNTEGAIENAGGDAATYKMACALKDTGIDAGACFLMMRQWNKKCSPPWSDSELFRKVQNAYKYAKNFGYEENNFGALPETELVHVSSFEPEPVERKWVVENFIPQYEMTALYGDGGLGKTYLALQLALNVATGEGSFLNRTIENPSAVLYVSAEDSVDEIHRRIYGICKNEEYAFLSKANAPLYFMPRWGKDCTIASQEGYDIKTRPFFEAIKMQLDKIDSDKGVLLILDPLATFFAVNENDKVAVSYCVHSVLSNLALEYKATILAVAHPSKASIQSKLYDSGSPSWRNSFREVRALVAHEDERMKKLRYLKHTKANYSAIQGDLLLEWENGRLVVRGEQEVERRIVGGYANHVYLAIVKAYKEKSLLGSQAASRRYICNERITDEESNILSKEQIRKGVALLRSEGLITETTSEIKITDNITKKVYMLKGLLPLRYMAQEEKGNESNGTDDGQGHFDPIF